MNSLIKQFLYILALSILCGFIRYFTLEDSVLDSNEFSPGPSLANIEYVKDLYDKGLGCFIDARDVNEFHEGHILNSINIPFDIDSTYDNDLLDSLANEIAISDDGKTNKVLIIYCSGEGCSLSEDLAYDLSNYFFEEVIFYFEEGFPVWKNLGYPIKASDLDISTNKSSKPLLNFIDYIIIASILLIFILYFSDTYKHFIPVISRLILGFIFIYFSWDKILDPKLFANVIKNYDIMPFGFEDSVALILPFIEFFIGVFLILGIFVDISATISLGLLFMFVLMIGQAYLRGKSIDCGCLLSDLSDTSSSEKRMYMIKRIIQDICFILYALIVKYRVIFKRDK